MADASPVEPSLLQRSIRIAKRINTMWIENRAVFALLVWLLDAIFTALIILKVPYTEIDWVAYMQEIEGVLGGEYNYSKLKGQTGPLVYPAGFVWGYSALHWLTSNGKNIQRAQLIFAGVYLLTQALVLRIYVKGKLLPAWALFLLMLSKRVHSLYVLRMFNDCICMLFLYGSVNLFIDHWWTLGCILFSLAVSVKMNVLLFSVPLLYLLLCAKGLQGAVEHIMLCGFVQIVVALPFLLSHPFEYVMGSFNLGRIFMHRWSVNLKFLPEEIFISKQLALGLLGLHLASISLFYFMHLHGRYKFKWNKEATKLSPEFVAQMMFTGNFIGIVFARTLHFQFYAWYFHAIPALLWGTDLQVGMRLGMFALIEMAFNITDPRGCHSSPKSPDCGSPLPHGGMVLTATHLLLLVAIFWSPRWIASKSKKS